MHPVIKIVSFLVIALFLARAGLYSVLLTLIFLLSFYLGGIRFSLVPVWQMLRRMRWLFISILVTYLWFTPGVPLIPSLEAYSPTVEGAASGLLRVAALFLIVTLVSLLLQTTTREELVGAIRWLATPLALLRVDRERLALRIILILDSVDIIQELLRQQITAFSTKGKKVSRIAYVMAELFQAVVNRAEKAPLHPITVVEQQWPPFAQWLYPFFLILLFNSGFCLNI